MLSTFPLATRALRGWLGTTGLERVLPGLAATFAGAAVTILGGCSGVGPLKVDIEGVAYTFPGEHVVRTVMPHEGSLYVVVRESGASFQLVYTARHQISRNYLEGAPLIPQINNVPGERFEQYDFAGGKTVCRIGPPHWNCGLRIEDSGVPWSVIFDHDQVPNSESLRKAATEQLASYRG